MLEPLLIQLLLLLGITVTVVLLFQHLRIPSSLAYLAVGLLLGPHTVGPALPDASLTGIAEFGIVFLLFAIGLSFPPAQIKALRYTVLGLGTAQVGFTTALVALLGYASGLPPVPAFIVGAVFAQSSTTIISRQLMDQGEYQSRHGRLGVAMSVFQDITAVPFVVVIPVLGAAGTAAIASSLGIAVAKAALAVVLVIIAGRYLLRPLLHLIAKRQSAELFTLAVLFVSLVAAGITEALGLSMAFGAFLVGMVIAETEFRHMVEATIRPFRDVLLGVFFISIGMLIDPRALPTIWPGVLLGAMVLLLSKIAVVTAAVRYSGVDFTTSLRTALLLAVGGEFGFALLALGLSAGVLEESLGQTVLMAVLLSMVLGAFLIRFNFVLSEALAQGKASAAESISERQTNGNPSSAKSGHVILCGFGRTGQTVGQFLSAEQKDYLALDIDTTITEEARLASLPAYPGDASDPDVLTAVGLESAVLLVICHSDRSAALRTIAVARVIRPDIPILARCRDIDEVEELRTAGATEVIPETVEASLIIMSHSLLSLDIPIERIAHHLREQRAQHYPMMREIFLGSVDVLLAETGTEVERLHAIRLQPDWQACGKALSDIAAEAAGVQITTIVSQGHKHRAPPPTYTLLPDDVLVVLGSDTALERLRQQLR